VKKELFPAKTGAFGSLTSLALLSGMLICFFLVLPSMWMTTLGKVFAVIWGVMTGAAAVAHLRVVNQKRQEIRLRRNLDKLSREMHAKRRREKQRVYLRS
jgi:Flp pilus assembly protein TadB